MKKINLHLILSIVFISCIANLGFAQSSNKLNVAISKPKMKATETYTKGNVYLELVMAEAISASSDLVNFVDRSELELINRHRQGGYKKLEGNQGSAQMEGVEYLLESKVLNVREKWENQCHVVKEEFMEKGKKVTKTTLDTCKHSSILVSFDMELELSSVETGEVISQRNITPSAWSYESYIAEPTDEDKTRMRVKAYNDMRQCFHIIWRNNLLKILQPEIRIIDISDERKGKAQKILLAGGRNVNFPSPLTMDVVKKYSEKIGDETIEREEKIGEVELESKFHKYSEWDVKKGKEEIFDAHANGEELYCIPTKMLKVESCASNSTRNNQIKKIKSTSKTITLEDKEKEKEGTNTNRSTKSNTTTTKKEVESKQIQINAKNPTTKKGGN